MKCKNNFFVCSFLICLLIGSKAYGKTVIPSGMAVGVCIQTEGLLVTGISEVTDENGHSVNAAYSAGV